MDMRRTYFRIQMFGPGEGPERLSADDDDSAASQGWFQEVFGDVLAPPPSVEEAFPLDQNRSCCSSDSGLSQLISGDTTETH